MSATVCQETVHPSYEYLDAAMAAVNAVAELEEVDR